ncbi:MAG: FAD-dependent monooxygenase [Sphingobium sp.]|nr:FAD-dependent monooxygenase [Sphingobium sp.]
MLRIAVAGCGPAGLAAALLLHRAGHDVTLFERFETPQPIGSGLMLQPTGLAVLEKLGLAETLLGTAARIDRLFGKAAPHGRTVLDVHYSSLGGADRFGLGIHRADLFACLYNAVQTEGIPVRTGQAITGSGLDGERRRLLLTNGFPSDPFDLVIDALGSRSTLAPLTGRSLAYGALWATLDWVEDAGFDWMVLQQRYHAARHMIGVLPVGTPRDAHGRKRLAFFWSLRADQLEAWRTAGLEAWKVEVRALWPETAPLLDQIRDPEQLVFARYGHRTLASPCEPALVHIGDAWHSASPQLGQGANMALLDAWALNLGLASDGTLAERLDCAIALRRSHVLLYQWMTAVFTPVYQSDSRIIPWARDWLIGPISKLWPATAIQAALVSGLVGNPLRKLSLL